MSTIKPRRRRGTAVGAAVAALVMAGVLTPTPASAASNCPNNHLCLYKVSFGVEIETSVRLVIPGSTSSRSTLGLFNNQTSSVSNRTYDAWCLTTDQGLRGKVMRVGPWENWNELPFWAEDDIESLYKCS
ncbi:MULTISPECIES: peptidase inhibitor family I36 protein [unclassified Streptomyces]|uniref:peptidase inhibitor family I36 protein n=1 Tax=unclassified Streptomyces TaxID=2593676 RepID=UPI00099050A0|nr:MULTISPECIES: peptidase inhibitor family I36 protein [unclassified Streptomyces]AQT76169.1 hypothetical protein B1K54_35365 [Streptomyces sp. fd1-xmd]MDX6762401.1 peptidase inhibitor family I36 protein [Streptomyces sp. F8]